MQKFNLETSQFEFKLKRKEWDYGRKKWSVGGREVKTSLFSRFGVRVKRQEMGKRREDRGKEAALGLLKVLKDGSQKKETRTEGGSKLIGLIQASPLNQLGGKEEEKKNMEWEGWRAAVGAS